MIRPSLRPAAQLSRLSPGLFPALRRSIRFICPRRRPKARPTIGSPGPCAACASTYGLADPHCRAELADAAEGCGIGEPGAYLHRGDEVRRLDAKVAARLPSIFCARAAAPNWATAALYAELWNALGRAMIPEPDDQREFSIPEAGRWWKLFQSQLGQDGHRQWRRALLRHGAEFGVHRL